MPSRVAFFLVFKRLCFRAREKDEREGRASWRSDVDAGSHRLPRGVETTKTGDSGMCGARGSIKGLPISGAPAPGDPGSAAASPFGGGGAARSEALVADMFSLLEARLSRLTGRSRRALARRASDACLRLPRASADRGRRPRPVRLRRLSLLSIKYIDTSSTNTHTSSILYTSI